MRYSSIYCLLFAGFATGVMAETEPKEETAKLAPIIVKEEDNKDYVPGTTVEQIKQATSLRELFTNTPGVTFIGGDGGILEDVKIRGVGGKANDMGVGSGRVALEIDGIPVPPSFKFGHEDTKGRAYFDLANIKTMTVSRGASFSPTSTGLAGTVSLTTRSAKDVLVNNRPVGIELGGGVRRPLSRANEAR
ncbi:TonB-dependent receptor plug domain-containing protein [Volucribacter amazonae]|uniref:TonB-dependent receptor plug domain-containing protein n=1 Tax=Volucribacter amazonae TaxID=256731 RepID=A0A9X4SI51_9PAST|nr:TonB-dependent receptor plug domain-containing protein [Volucribacter amazonae]MDG6895302.1 hypothetical protein [Volucribacter amazonae]